MNPTPLRRWLVKTADAKGAKVFINICSSSRIGAPGNWSGNQACPEALYHGL